MESGLDAERKAVSRLAAQPAVKKKKKKVKMPLKQYGGMVMQDPQGLTGNLLPDHKAAVDFTPFLVVIVL